MSADEGKRKRGKGLVSQAPVPSGKGAGPKEPEEGDGERAPATPSDTGQPDEQAVAAPPSDSVGDGAGPGATDTSRRSFRDETGNEPRSPKAPPRH